MERLGILGGTFDPVHVAHVVVAVEVRWQLGLDRVLLVPAGDPWQKRGSVVASAHDRLALVEAAVADVAGLEASPIEVEREGASVTLDTLRALSAPERALYLLLGADVCANMATWRGLEATKPLATIVAMERKGERAAPPGAGWRVEHVPVTRIDVSSSELRERLRTGRPVDGLVPAAAVRVLRERGLYTGG